MQGGGEFVVVYFRVYVSSIVRVRCFRSSCFFSGLFCYVVGFFVFAFVGVCIKGLDCGIGRSSLERMVRRCKAMRSMGLVASHSAEESGNFTFVRVPRTSRTGGTVARLGKTRCTNHPVMIGRTLPEGWSWALEWREGKCHLTVSFFIC